MAKICREGGANRGRFSASPTAYRACNFWSAYAQAASVRRNDFRTIEHLLRAGHKKLKLLGMPGVKAAEGVTVNRR